LEALAPLVASADPQLPGFLTELLEGNVRTADGKVFLMKGDAARDFAGAAAKLPESAEEVVNNNRMRKEIEGAMAALALISPDLAVRKKAVAELKDQIDESKLPLLEKAFAAEADAGLQQQIGQLRALALITSADKTKRIAAAKMLAESENAAVKSILVDRLKKDGETDEDVRFEIKKALSAVEGRLVWGERLGVVFTGASLGSILLLVALGLATWLMAS
jgi:urea transport system permease protein